MGTNVYTGSPARGARAWLRAIAPPLAVTATAGACWAAVVWADPLTPGGPIPVCPTKAWLGVVCPGCGAMRMLAALLHGDLPAALRFNAVALVAMLLFGWSVAAWTAGRRRGRYVPSWQHWRWAPAVAGVVLAVWFLVRNLPFAPFDALRV